MNTNRTLAILLIFAALPTAAGDSPQLGVSVSTPNVDIVARPATQTSIRLPQLDFEFRLDTRCADQSEFRSAMISIADTRQRLVAGVPASEPPPAFTMSVPASQIAPLGIGDFCVVSEAGDDGPVMQKLFRGALSAQVSMLCAGETGEQVTYASASLDVALNCVTEP